MRQKTLTILITACFLLAAPLTATTQEKEERYLCVANKATGFYYYEKTKTWEPINNVMNEKYLIAKATIRKAKFEIIRVGEKSPICWSERGFTSYSEAFFECYGGEARFDQNSGRFLYAYLIGYTDGIENNDNNPHIVIGKCSPF